MSVDLPAFSKLHVLCNETLLQFSWVTQLLYTLCRDFLFCVLHLVAWCPCHTQIENLWCGVGLNWTQCWDLHHCFP